MEACCKQLAEEITITTNGIDISGKAYVLNEEDTNLFKKIQSVALKVTANKKPDSYIIYCILKKRTERLQDWEALGKTVMEAAYQETQEYPELAGKVKSLLERVIPLLCESLP